VTKVLMLYKLKIPVYQGYSIYKAVKYILFGMGYIDAVLRHALYVLEARVRLPPE